MQRGRSRARRSDVNIKRAPKEPANGNVRSDPAAARDECQCAKTGEHQRVGLGFRNRRDGGTRRDGEATGFERVDRTREHQARDLAAGFARELDRLVEGRIAVGHREAQARSGEDLAVLGRAVDRQCVVEVRRAPQETDVVDRCRERQRSGRARAWADVQKRFARNELVRECRARESLGSGKHGTTDDHAVHSAGQNTARIGPRKPEEP